MASSAYSNVLVPLLNDPDELERAHRQLRTGQPGRQWGIGSLNRAVVVMCVSAWEAYVEELAIEAVNSLQPPEHAITVWQSLNASVRTQVGRFNNPNVENTKKLISDAIGLQDVTLGWSWQNCTRQRAVDRLTEVIRLRHEVAHGVNPRPTIHNRYSNRLSGFFRQLGRHTDSTIRDYLENTLRIINPWP
jgi:hypothetical protein